MATEQDKCVGGTRTLLEINSSADCECVSISSIVFNQNGTMTVTLSNGSSYTSTSLVGPTGATGATGPAPSIVNEAWKDIGNGGNFANGQPVPDFIVAGTSVGSSPIQVRKTWDNKVAIRGYFIADAVWFPGANLFMLPAGYRPTSDVCIGWSTDGLVANVVMWIRATGYVEIDVYVGTDIYIPEFEISLD